MLLSAFSLLTSCSSAYNGTKTNTFSPIIDNNAADPSVFQANNMYYYTHTPSEDKVTIWRSKNLSTVAAGESKTIWNVESGYENPWAPEIKRINNVWYIYIALEKVGSGIHQMYVLSNASTDPFKGEWKFEKLAGMDDKFAIDGTVFSSSGKTYFVWSGWSGYEDVAQNLYISQMISPTEVTKGQKIEISHPQYSWELMETPVINEGPEVIIHNGVINLTYSASGSWSNDYCLGLITSNVSDNLLDSKSWTKQKEPIFSSTSKTSGPGHNSFATSENGKENWLIFHAARVDGSGWSRSVRLQKFTWTKSNTIKLAQPLNASTQQLLPAGEANRIKILANKGVKSKGLTFRKDDQSNSKQVVSGFEDPSENLSFKFSASKQSYTIIVYVKTEDFSNPEDNTQQLSLIVNGKETDIDLSPSQYYQPVQFQTTLKDKNSLVIGSSVGGSKLSIDALVLAKN